MKWFLFAGIAIAVVLFIVVALFWYDIKNPDESDLMNDRIMNEKMRRWNKNPGNFKDPANKSGNE